jgi:predicted SAM-dependent methyltransferase
MAGSATQTLGDYIRSINPSQVKLHLGCGGVRWLDFINIDLHPHDETKQDDSRDGCFADVFADMRNLGLPDESIDEIFTSHTIDHFTRWEAIDMLRDWFRMLKPGGLIVIEAADFNRCIFWLFHPNGRNRQLARNQFYGNQWDRIDYETHRYVWSARELRSVLREIGFRRVESSHATQTHYPGRDMRITAAKYAGKGPTKRTPRNNLIARFRKIWPPRS